MDIVHELNQLDYGGAERVVRNIVKFDKKNKHRVVAYKDGPFRKELEEAGAVVVVPQKDVEEDMEADVIHIHSGGGISNMALNLGKAFPVIETIHSPLRSPMRDDFIRQRVGVSDAVSVKNSKCITILNGVDPDDHVITRTIEEVKAELGIPEGKIVVGRLGRLGPDKGLEDWLMTCHKLQRLGYDFVPLVIGGEANGLKGTFVGKMKLTAQCLPVKDVIWAGHKTDIHNYLQVMDIFLYPSPTEGFGLVFMEAMLNGCTVVTYKTDVTWELLAGHAILTEKSIDGLVAGMQKAFNPSMREAYQGIVHNFVVNHYDAENMSLAYQELYERSVGHSNGSDKPETADSVSA